MKYAQHGNDSFCCLFARKRLTLKLEKTEKPFVPEPILTGGVVMSLYAADSPRLKRERIHEPERYNTALKNKSDKTVTVLNVHNPSIEVHLAGDDQSNSGAAVIIAPGGGHQILWVGPEGADFVPFFKKYGVSTIVLRNRLRVDGYEPKTDAVNDAFQAIRMVRAHAAEWKLDPAKIGIMGFSAGAELSAPTAIFFEDFERDNSDQADPLAMVSARPDFVGVIYPGPTPFTKDPTTRIPQEMLHRVLSPPQVPATGAMRWHGPLTISQPC